MNRDMCITRPFLLHCWLLSQLLLFCVACADTADDSAAAGRTTSVRLLIPRPEAATRTGFPSEGYETNLTVEESAIHTLRVVIYSLRENNNATTINRFYTEDELAKAQQSSTGNYVLTIGNVPLGTAQICVVVNEASIGQDYTDILTMQNQAVETGDYSKVLITDPNYAFFPKRGTELLAENPKKGLPMSWMGKNHEITGGDQISVELKRCVAKLRMAVKNNFTADIRVDEISFGQFFGNSFYLFKEAELDVPPEQIYKEQVYTDEVAYTIRPGESKVLICYLYPSFAWTSGTTASPYTIGFKTQHGDYPQMAFLHMDGTRFNSIPRNKQVNIGVTLSGKTHIEVDFEVVDWADVDITVPDFD